VLSRGGGAASSPWVTSAAALMEKKKTRCVTGSSTLAGALGVTGHPGAAKSGHLEGHQRHREELPRQICNTLLGYALSVAERADKRDVDGSELSEAGGSVKQRLNANNVSSEPFREDGTGAGAAR
jgi:hypothetical protein